MPRILGLGLSCFLACASTSKTQQDTPQHQNEGLPWIDDDWAAAQTAAQNQQKPILVDIWATWCHACLSMKNYTLLEAPVLSQRDKFIWLALDFDRPENAAFFEKFAITAVPTFVLIEPTNFQVYARQLGSSSAQEFAQFLATVPDSRDATLKAADQALLQGDHAKAVSLLEPVMQSMVVTEQTWFRHHALYIEALWQQDHARCALEGARHINAIPNNVKGLEHLALLAYCALDQPDDVRLPVLNTIAQRFSQSLQQDLPLSVDDRSSIYGTLIMLLDHLGRSSEVPTLVQQRLELLENAAKFAPTIATRSTFDAHRLECYLRLQKYPEAEVMLLASQTAHPTDFNHPWRLAQLYLAWGRHQDGLRAIEQALAVGYGGRRIRLFTTKLDLLLKTGAQAAALETVKTAEAELPTYPKAQTRPGWIQEFEARRAEVQSKFGTRPN